MGCSLCIKSFAKLNLYLEVLKKRPDSYHNLITLFERINLYDKIYIKERSDTIINIRSNLRELCQPPEDNLVYKAVKVLKDNLKINKGLDIYIEKSIPIASGLGGGSSNAGATLLGLNKFFHLRLTKDELLSYAKKLGADVPFFLYNCSFALGKGRGDLVKPLNIKNIFWHILILPNIKVLTKDIYYHLDRLKNKLPELTKKNSHVKMLIKGLRERDFKLIEKNIYNELEKVSFSLYPELDKIKMILKRKGLKNIFMSGSGPAMFSLFSSRKEAEWFKRQLDNQRRFKVILVHTI